jgi:hypothetical protein
MYSFMLDQSYINLFILVIIVAIVMFLWRKLIILEGNFFVLEKRVNLIKKDAREDSIAKNIDKADIIMNEIFKDFSPSNACKKSMCGGVGGSGSSGGSGKAVCETSEAGDADDDEDICYPQKGGAYNIPIGESRSGVDPDIITFVNGGNVEIDLGAASGVSGVSGAVDEVNEVDALAALATTISSSEEYENKMRIADVVVMDAATDAADAADAAETDTMSVCSEITFTSDDKKSDNALKKKYVKMSLDKLKDVCISFNISGEGTRNELINRIIKVKN